MSRLITPTKRSFVPRIARTENRVRHLEVNKPKIPVTYLWTSHGVTATGGNLISIPPNSYADCPVSWSIGGAGGGYSVLVIPATGLYLLLLEDIRANVVDIPPKASAFVSLDGSGPSGLGYVTTSIPFVTSPPLAGGGIAPPGHPEAGGVAIGSILFLASANQNMTIRVLNNNTTNYMNIGGARCNATVIRLQ